MIFHVNTCTGEHALGSPTAIVYGENYSTKECLRMTREFGYSETGFLKDSGDLRFFGATGEFEDEACVSAHGILAPFFSAQVGKTNLKAHQRSPRGGNFRVDISKYQAEIYAEAEIFEIE